MHFNRTLDTVIDTDQAVTNQELAGQYQRIKLA